MDQQPQSKPLTLTQLRENFLPIMRMMALNRGMYIDFSYKGRLYRMNLEDLDIDFVARRRPRRKNLVDNVKARKCPTCKKLMLNNVCMSSLCPTNLSNELNNKPLELPTPAK